MGHPRQLLKELKLHASRQRGQNFLVQPATARAIAAAAGLEPGDQVVEIGAGLGALTLALAPLAARVLAVEVDRGVHAALGEVLAQAGAENVEPLLADALDLDWAGLARRAGRPLKVVGNLPYSISSPMIFKLIEARRHWISATLLLQRELATRLAAAPGGRDYGRLGVLAQTFCQISPDMVLGPEQFFPRPAVESRLVHLRPRPKPLGGLREDEEAWFSRVVKAAFGQRRKTLLNSLTHGLGLDRPAVAAGLQRAGIEPGRRAETLAPQELLEAARALGRP